MQLGISNPGEEDLAWLSSKMSTQFCIIISWTTSIIAPIERRLQSRLRQRNILCGWAHHMGRICPSWVCLQRNKQLVVGKQTAIGAKRRNIPRGLRHFLRFVPSFLPVYRPGIIKINNWIKLVFTLPKRFIKPSSVGMPSLVACSGKQLQMDCTKSSYSVKSLIKAIWKLF